MSLRLFLLRCREMLRNFWEVAFGSLPRQAVSLLTVLLVVLIWNSIGEDEPRSVALEELDRAINLSHHYERENRRLRGEIEAERRLRRVAEQTIAALSDNLRGQDESILDMQQQLAFFRQLLEERESPGDEIVIRSFEIVPDYRENSYQLLTVLVRSSAESEPFKGRLTLALSLRGASGEEIEYSPVFQVDALDAEFRYYHEIEAVFSIPGGTEILNGQLALFSEDGSLMTSRILIDELI